MVVQASSKAVAAVATNNTIPSLSLTRPSDKEALAYRRLPLVTHKNLEGANKIYLHSNKILVLIQEYI